MRIGCFSVLFGNQDFNEAIKIISGLGCEMVEIGTGNYPGNAHCDPSIFLKDQNEITKFQKVIIDHDMEISALSCHGNPLHPSKSISELHHRVQRETILLAEKMNIPVVNTFSGCPGDSDDSKFPNWVTCPWPDDFLKILEWQWEQKVIPYWKKEAEFAEEHGVKIAFEMHPGFVVYNPETLLKVRKECGSMLGANFDPSHLWWQGIDPIKAVRSLKDTIFHVHAKDTKIYPPVEINGVLDTKPYSDEIKRSWIFRTVGDGHSTSWWKNFVSTLRMVGYDYVLSIEHEDSLMCFEEGLSKAITVLKEAIITKKPGEMFWV